MTNPDHIQFLNPSTLGPPPGYSHIAKVIGGQTIYISGQVALDTSNHIVGHGDFRVQAQQVFENIKTALAAVGADFSHVVKFNIYLLDRSQISVLREVRDMYVNRETPPTSTLVEVRSLAREEFLLEIETVASIATI